MAAKANKCARQRFVDFLAQKNLRLTGQRQAIIETVFSTEQHFTAEQLLEWSRRRDKSVSRATVYRTLPLLTESGLVREMDFGKEHKFYDPNYAEHPRHNHIICQDCGKIVEFESDKIERLENGELRGIQKAGHLLEEGRLAARLCNSVVAGHPFGLEPLGWAGLGFRSSASKVPATTLLASSGRQR
jgi:Fur family ferric uptake transcriptional regulator